MNVRTIIIAALVALSGVAQNTVHAQPPSDGLVGYWPFIGGAEDWSSSGFNGILLGEAKATYLLSVDDNDEDAMQLPSAAMDGLSNFTISVWGRINTLHTDAGGANTLLTGMNEQGNESIVVAYHGDQGHWRIVAGSTELLVSDARIEDGGWHHILITRNAGFVRLLIDRQPVGSLVGLPGALGIDDGELIVGQNGGEGGVLFDEDYSWAGAIDNLRLYNYAVNPSEITELFEEGHSVPQYSVTVSIDSANAFVPAEGGTVLYNLEIVNQTTEMQFAEYWTRLIYPDGTEVIGPFGQGQITVEPGGAVTRRSSGRIARGSAPGTYTVRAYVGAYHVDTLETGDTTFQKLAVPCSEIDLVRARCQPGGLLQMQALMTGSTAYAGEQMFFDVNGTVYSTTILANQLNSKAVLQLAGQAAGSYTVSLLPAGCYAPIQVTCGSGRASGEPEDWMEEASEPVSALSGETRLLGNYPNPFNPATKISFFLEDRSDVTLTVYDLLGREVAVPARALFEPGTHTVTWDAAGRPSGVYFYRLVTATTVLTGRVQLVR